ncbi:ribulose-phosphate 3-epimerase [Amphibacillus sp. Q70]|uniref:ribulose-phosphate 3-epimerase n=1 Tax=Amphibacillus sp. Q70 TaxID=3453416 RepID=UPI003F82B7A2
MKYKENPIYVAPSLERCDWLNMENELEQLEAAGVDLFHIDIMDRTYGQIILMSPNIVPMIKKITSVPLDIHMYVSEPEVYFPKLFECCKGDYISIQLEAVTDISRILEVIHKNGCKPAISIEMATPVSSLEEIIDQVDLINLLVRNNGFSHKPIKDSMLKKVAKVKQMIVESGRDILLEVDGSIDFDDTIHLIEKGADTIVYGTKVIFRDNIPYAESMKELRRKIEL